MRRKRLMNPRNVYKVTGKKINLKNKLGIAF